MLARCLMVSSYELVFKPKLSFCLWDKQKEEEDRMYQTAMIIKTVRMHLLQAQLANALLYVHTSNFNAEFTSSRHLLPSPL